MDISRERILAVSALIGIQVAHALTPTKAAPENAFGYALGFSALVVSAIAWIGVVQRRDWGRQLLGLIGAGIAAGFVLLHGIPARNVFTDPYVGRHPAVGPLPWAVVIIAIVVGVWCAIVSVRKPAEVDVPAVRSSS